MASADQETGTATGTGTGTGTGTVTRSGFQYSDCRDDTSSDYGAELEIHPDNISNTIITKAPPERFKLGYWSVIGLVVNRVIGTGIFNSPSTIVRGTRSTGIALLFWLAGAIYTIAGTHLNIEFGLTTPRYNYKDVERGIPRSGGALNYLQYVFQWPAYRPHTFQLITCIFAAAYIILGNMAGNCLIFGMRILEAADAPVTNGAVRGIAIAAATFACGIHAFSRRGGIWLGNIFAVIKVMMLLLIIITGICAWVGVFGTENYSSQNLAANSAFLDPSDDSYGYVKAFLAVIFAWSGFDQPNYVLSEIGRPHKKFPWGTSIGVSIVCILYLFVNIAYMVVVPVDQQMKPGNNVALLFFQLTFGKLSSENSRQPNRILSAFMAISSFGNIVVMTFTAARVKQEIAKEGLLPWAKFFGQSRNYSLGRFIQWLQSPKRGSLGRALGRMCKQPWLKPEQHSQETPFGALFLHWIFTILMILVTIHHKPADAYGILVDLYSYTIVAVFGVAISIGMLKLRFSRRANWRKKSNFNPFFSILSASVFGIGSLYPVIASWVPPTGAYSKTLNLTIAWFTTPTVAWTILAFGASWWLMFLLYANRRHRKDGVEFRVEKEQHFEPDPLPDGPPVQVHEKVFIAWVAKENVGNTDVVSVTSRESY